jgi:hypothetical protein
LGDSYWLYVVWNPLENPDPEPLKIRNPVKHLDHAKREVVRYFDIPADAIENLPPRYAGENSGDSTQQLSSGIAWIGAESALRRGN